jgi:type IV pilus assembly protein PilW
MSAGLRVARRAFVPASGFTLVELMIAMALGLLVVGASISMFLSFSNTYNASESLSRVQENARIAFELMTRDLREAGGNPCSRWVPVANVLNGAGSSWWNSWGNGVVGYDNGALAGSLAGTDALEIMSGSSTSALVTNHNPLTAQFTLTPLQHGFVAGDILMACDYFQGAIFQMTGPAANPVTDGTVFHQNSGTPGNCSRGLGFRVPMNCTAAGSPHTFDDNTMVVRLQAERWYIAPNGRGRNSLFRVALRANALGAPEEVVDGVADMQLTYLIAGANSYVAASAVPANRWRDVSAVRIAINLAGAERVGTDASVINRRVEHTVTLRSRNT